MAAIGSRVAQEVLIQYEVSLVMLYDTRVVAALANVCGPILQAGMGGKSGPYRVDGGYDVYQIEEAQKAAVSEKVRETQRAMRLERYRARLDQINMNEQEASLYEQYMRKVQLQVCVARPSC